LQSIQNSQKLFLALKDKGMWVGYNSSEGTGVKGPVSSVSTALLFIPFPMEKSPCHGAIDRVMITQQGNITNVYIKVLHHEKKKEKDM